MSGVPYTFGTATTSIPLSNLDSNFVTPVTIGNASVALGNTISTIGNLTLNNVTINGGTINASVTGSYSLANAVVYSNSSNLGVTSANLTFDGTTLTSLNTAYTGTLTGGTGVVNLGSGQFYKDASGNVGIGNTPTAAYAGVKNFQVGQTQYIFANNSNFGGGFIGNAYLDASANMKYATTGPATYYNNQSGFHTWFYAASGTAGNAVTFNEAMRIDSSGNLLVGTTTGTTSGGYYFAVGSSSSFDTGHATGTASGTTFQRYTYAGSVIGSISQSGTTAVLYNLTSDARLKTNIVDAPVGNIDSIKVRSFDWKSDGSHVDYGFIAQELVEVAPYAVHQPQDSEEMMAVDYSKLVPMMIKEIQDLKQRIATLEAK